MLVYLNSSGQIIKVPEGTDLSGTGYLVLGFALNSQANSGSDPAATAGDGDVISSGKIGMINLDGSSVIETDQFYGAASLWTIGKPVYCAASGEGNGFVSVTTTENHRTIGYVVGVRYLPARRAGSQAYINYLPYNYDGTSANAGGAGTSITTTDTLQTTTAMVAIKLAA